ncbi:MAG: sulfatase-like hydrolase/transferase [Puniceicoccales bacterium]
MSQHSRPSFNPRLNRRTFLESLAALSGVMFFGPAVAQAASQTPAKRPNILWIMTDQQFAGAMSCAGNPWVRTPAMDSIAARGVRFTNAYCTNPICIPSRAGMITGRYPHEVGMTTNIDEHELDSPSLGMLMKDRGYSTGYVGKWHIPMPADDASWHGFDYIRHALPNKLDWLVADSCEEFLNSDPAEPWFLVASFVNPHDICEWARMASGIKDEYKNGSIPPAPDASQCPPIPENFAIPEGEPSVIRELQAEAVRTYPVRDWDEEKWRQYQWAYYRLVEKVDAEIQKILDALAASGQLDNTIIAFTSDHGDGLGSHQWNQKTLFYEESARVPFMVAGPGVKNPGSVNDTALVSSGLDLAATFADYAGDDLPDDYHGVSVKGIVEEQANAPTHPYVVSENDLAPRYNHTGGIYGRMLRSPRYKYVVYSEGENPEQLFDLKADPGELNDLTLDPANAALVEQHRELLRQHLRATNDTFTAATL